MLLFRLLFFPPDIETHGQFGLLSEIIPDDEPYLGVFVRQAAISQGKHLPHRIAPVDPGISSSAWNSRFTSSVWKRATDDPPVTRSLSVSNYIVPVVFDDTTCIGSVACRYSAFRLLRMCLRNICIPFLLSPNLKHEGWISF